MTLFEEELRVVERWWVGDVASIDVLGDNVVVVSLYKVVHPSSIQFSDYSTMQARSDFERLSYFCHPCLDTWCDISSSSVHKSGWFTCIDKVHSDTHCSAVALAGCWLHLLAGTEPASKLDPAAPLLLPRPLFNFTSGISLLVA